MKTCRKGHQHESKGWCTICATNNRLIKTYGITLEEYNILRQVQNYKCGICKCSEEDNIRNSGAQTLVIDHDHSTKRIRGLLCHRCNVGLGNFKDSITTLEFALNYLQRNQ